MIVARSILVVVTVFRPGPGGFAYFANSIELADSLNCSFGFLGFATRLRSGPGPQNCDTPCPGRTAYFQRKGLRVMYLLELVNSPRVEN